jgi:hypothetical protein
MDSNALGLAVIRPVYRNWRVAFYCLFCLCCCGIENRCLARDVQRETLLTQKIVGQWERRGHVRAFYGDGAFFIDPEPETRPVGKWAIRGGELLIWWPPGKKVPTRERILQITKSKLVTEGRDGRRSFRRIEHY